MLFRCVERVGEEEKKTLRYLLSFSPTQTKKLRQIFILKKVFSFLLSRKKLGESFLVLLPGNFLSFSFPRNSLLECLLSFYSFIALSDLFPSFFTQWLADSEYFLVFQLTFFTVEKRKHKFKSETEIKQMFTFPNYFESVLENLLHFLSLTWVFQRIFQSLSLSLSLLCLCLSHEKHFPGESLFDLMFTCSFFPFEHEVYLVVLDEN